MQSGCSRVLLLTFLAFAMLLAGACGPGAAPVAPPATGTTPPDAVDAPAPARAPVPVVLPARVLVLGASVSAGFQMDRTAGETGADTVRLEQALRPWLDAAGGSIESFADSAAFFNPLRQLGNQIERARNAAPDLVIGIDLAFWYGYGSFRGDDVEAARLQRFEQGLGQIATLRCPLLLGDVPDMRHASQRMLAPSMVPHEATLAKMNERLRAFAAEHANVRLFPLAALATRCRQEDVELGYGDRRIVVPPNGFLQPDRLHVNRLGIAWLALQLQQPMRELAPARRWPTDWPLLKFVDAVDAHAEAEGFLR
jgi:hypothetical protein